jgi:hypothetical protein
MNLESYVEGLKAELLGAKQAKNKDHEKAVTAELKRATSTRETAVVDEPAVETRDEEAPAAPTETA